jgi:hypothetical protein
MSAKDISASLDKLSINTSNNPKKASKKKVVADSWEDEELSSSDTESETTPTRGRSTDEKDAPSAPPPTPASPSGHYPTTSIPYENPYASVQPSRERQQTPDKRPEKTASTAARMIAGSLGLRAPKRTAEEREYDNALKEKERRRRDEEREKAKEQEKLKASVWEE